MRMLIWLAGWDEYTIENVLSAIRKAMAEAKRREQPPVRRTEKPSAGRKGSF